MRAFHLSVLGLSPNPSEQEIKAAYRDLSKKYHPDVNNQPEATARFIEIKHAYEYLTKVPQTVFEQEATINDGLSDLEIWRREAKKRARAKAKEKQLYQENLIRKVNQFLRPVVLALLLVNILFVLDYCLPAKPVEQRILELYNISEGGKRGRQYYDLVKFENYEMKFGGGEIRPLNLEPDALVYATQILNVPLKATFNLGSSPRECWQVYNIYIVFGYLIPVLIVLCAMFLRLEKPTARLNLGIVASVLSLIQIVVYLS